MNPSVLLRNIPEDLIEGIHVLAETTGFPLASEDDDGDISLSVFCRPGPIHIIRSCKMCRIEFERKIHFFRAFGLMLEQIKAGRENFELTETPYFEMSGAMLDCSRNGVLNPAAIKDYLRYMALMGLDSLMLYTEDTYEVQKYPYFGYMRGRYTCDELKECDDYANQFGIEMFPCIQTLGHLAMVLRWPAMKNLSDLPGVLLADNDETYQFIRACIEAASAPFRSKKINICMDEAHGVGTGRYKELFGDKPPYSIMNSHMCKVADICKSLGLSPMAWSDMYFRLCSKTNDYYDLDVDLPEKAAAGIPPDVSLVYWDYYHDDPSFYESFVKKHRRMGKEPIFAGGVWTWGGPVVNYGKTFRNATAALHAMKHMRVRRVFYTQWGDGGQECSHFAGLLGAQFYAEHSYHAEVDENTLFSRFKFCTGANGQLFKDFTLLAGNPGDPYLSGQTDGKVSNTPKCLLYQDIMCGKYDAVFKNTDCGKWYHSVYRTLEKYPKDQGRLTPVVFFYRSLAAVLDIKADIGIQLKEAYDNTDRDKLNLYCAKVLPELKNRLVRLHKAHRDLWFLTCKSFGWDCMDLKYAYCIARVDFAIYRLEQYLYGKVPALEELAEPRLTYDSGPQTDQWPDMYINSFTQIYTHSATN